MDHRISSAPACPVASAFVIALATALLTVVAAPNSYAQPAPTAPAPAPAPKAPPKAPAKAQPKAQPAPAPEQPAPQAQGDQPQLVFSPWTKFCLKGQEANAKQVCFTGKDGRVETGQPVVAAVLIEPDGETRKILRITLPLGMSIQPGTRAIVDQGQPMQAPYVICFNNGCMADYEASGELINNLKRGKGLVVQGINGAGQPISLVLPLGDFAKAYEGPPTDPKVFEEQQTKLQNELARRAEEARKKLEAQGGAPPAAPAR
jgi:invasion protein IalB